MPPRAPLDRSGPGPDLSRAVHSAPIGIHPAALPFDPRIARKRCLAPQARIKIGTSTGYFAEAAQVASREGAAQGYMPDHNVAPNEVPSGRPAPWMIYRNMEALAVYPPAAVVKIGDTVPDIEEGLAAGVWSIGVTHSGSDVGCTVAEFAELGPAERQTRVDRARQRLVSAGAHLVVDSVADVPNLITTINGLLAKGERPQK